MRALVQRVGEASVAVGSDTIGHIGTGLVALVGATHGDLAEHAERLADKIWNLRIFPDDAGQMNRSCADVGGAVMVVSQFTLYGDTRRGRRPGWSDAAAPDIAEPLIEHLAAHLEAQGATVARGRFQALMRVSLVNDGPVTLLLEVP